MTRAMRNVFLSDTCEHMVPIFILLLFSGEEDGCCLGRNGRCGWPTVVVVSHSFHFAGDVRKTWSLLVKHLQKHAT